MSRGRCSDCACTIPIRYPLIEGACALIGLWAGICSDTFLVGLVTSLLGWNLLIIAIIDAEHFWIPDQLTVPLFVTGVIAAVVLHPAGAIEALPEALIRPLLGAIVGFGGLWTLALLYKWVRGRDGLGGGDPILLGACGAWVGWAGLSTILLWACVAGLSVVLAILIIRRRISGTDRLPFGVFLAIGTWLTWLYGPLGLS